jgi:hypothetical protein
MAPGEIRDIGHGTELAVQLNSFDFSEDSRLESGPASEITFLNNGVSVGSARLRIGRPAVHQGVAVRQLGFVPVVRMSGQDSAEHPLAFQVGGRDMGASTEAQIVFASPTERPVVLIVGYDRFLTLNFDPQGGNGRPALEVLEVDLSAGASGSADPMLLAALTSSGEVEMGELRIAVELGYHPILRIDQRPGMALAVAGFALAVVALALVWLLPPHLLWIAAEAQPGGSTTIHLLARAGARGSLWPDRLSVHLQETLDDDG